MAVQTTVQNLETILTPENVERLLLRGAQKARARAKALGLCLPQGAGEAIGTGKAEGVSGRTASLG